MLGPHANSSMDLIQVDTGAVCPDAANEHWNGATGDVKNFQCPRLGSRAIWMIWMILIYGVADGCKYRREGGKIMERLEIYRTPV